ncbi:MAG: glycosyltransferase [Solirubrobacterales bacterium]
MIKVLHVISDTNIGGAGRYLINLIKSRSADEFEVTVACPRGGRLWAELEPLGVPLEPIPHGEKSFSIANFRSLLAIIRSRTPDVVHTHASLAGRLAARFAGVPVVLLTRHTIGAPVPGWKKPLIRLQSVWLSDLEIACSHAVADALLAQGTPADRIRTIYNGIDLAEAGAPVDSPSLRDQCGFSAQTPVVGTVARLTWEKGLPYFLTAAAKIHAENQEVRFVIVGAGPLETALKEAAVRLGIDQVVLFVGYQANVPAWIDLIDVAVVSSITEALSLALIEMMAQAKPIAASAVGGIPEVVTDGIDGLLVPPADSDRLAAAVLRLLNDRLLAKRLGRTAAETVAQRFSATVMAANVEQCYRELLAPRLGDRMHQPDRMNAEEESN